MTKKKKKEKNLSIKYPQAKQRTTKEEIARLPGVERGTWDVGGGVGAACCPLTWTSLSRTWQGDCVAVWSALPLCLFPVGVSGWLVQEGVAL